MVTKKSQKKTTRHASKMKKWLIGILGGIILLAIIVWLAFQLSPWPSALLIRHEFTEGGLKTAKALEKHVPAGIAEIENQQYRANDNDAYLDVFYPDKTNKPLATVIWTHGGAWVSGDKDEVDNYMKILASHGFTVVSVNYSIAPEKQYPTPIVQLNAALSYVKENAARLNSDARRIVLAGDSAGSQIAAQMANIITSPSYAKKVGIEPSLAPDSLKGVLLNCGAYDLALPDYDGAFGDFLHTVLWAYSGTKNFRNDPRLEAASVANYVTPAFPPAFITAGNVDPLLPQSTELAKRLKKQGVVTDTLFYAKDHTPQLNHEYQFNLDTHDGKKALTRMVGFLKTHTARR